MTAPLALPGHITRFAPSPTGYLHLGHAAAALIAAEAAGQGGRVLLRIEDIDPQRCRPAYDAALREDLAWLGFAWDGPVRVQSQHLADYRAVLDRLAGEGLLYPCFCTRADIAREVAAAAHAPHGPDGAPRYPGTCRVRSAAERADRIAAGAPHAWRLDMQAALHRTGPLTWHEVGVGPQACDAAAFGDVVLGRRDVPGSYHLSVTHDDALQGVTLVTRGEDLRAATAVQRVLQALLAWPTPQYRHHRLLTDETGRRLAKRDAAQTLRMLRAAGLTPAEVRLRALSASSPP